MRGTRYVLVNVKDTRLLTIRNEGASPRPLQPDACTLKSPTGLANDLSNGCEVDGKGT